MSMFSGQIVIRRKIGPKLQNPFCDERLNAPRCDESLYNAQLAHLIDSLEPTKLAGKKISLPDMTFTMKQPKPLPACLSAFSSSVCLSVRVVG